MAKNSFAAEVTFKKLLMYISINDAKYQITQNIYIFFQVLMTVNNNVTMASNQYLQVKCIKRLAIFL